MEDQIEEDLTFISPPKDSVQIWQQLIKYCKKKRAAIQLYAKVHRRRYID